MEQHVLAWITQYGYVAIFALLVLGIVGLPVPDETLLTFVGYLIFRHKLELPLAFLSALAGSVCGISISYGLGRIFGMKLIHRYGKYLRIKDEHLAKAHAWFERAGHWSLTFGYFVPGVRHFTAYAAGIAELKAPAFMLFAYSGAVLWVSVFLTLGYFLGDRWETVSRDIHRYILTLAIALAVMLAAYLVLRKRRQAAGK